MKCFVRKGSASNILYNNLRVKSGKIFLSADPSRLSLSISRLWWLLRRVSALLALHESWRHVIKMIDLKMSIMGSFVLYQTTSIHWPWPKIPGEKSMKINNYFRHCMWVTESVGWVDNYGYGRSLSSDLLSIDYHCIITSIPPVAQHYGLLSVLWVSKVVYFLSEAFWLTAPR